MNLEINKNPLSLQNMTRFYKGKVRDVYTFGDRMMLVASDRISAFDHILPKPIPFKGQVLNQMASYFLKNARDIVPNWLLEVPAPNAAYGLACEPVRVEMVIRGYLAGHAWRVYSSGLRTLCGVTLPEGLKEGDKLPFPVITPTTKADEGHDADISREEILTNAIVPKEIYEKMERYTQALFERGTSLAASQGLILVDTKYEFGLYKGEIYLIDEIHTPDSSRYFYADGYEERQKSGERQTQLSKEFVREWLMHNGFQGKEGQRIPEMPEDFVNEVSERYIQLFEKITGLTFVKSPVENLEQILNDFLIHANKLDKN
jgi:phosphoribosylaminoimidazole-succinocarboxamide synthase